MIASLILPAAIAQAAPAAADKQPQTAVDAERAFVRDAQTLGQWTAFRKYAAEDGIMFSPQPVKAQTLLKDTKDPPASVYWWPGRSFASCDGTHAINTGPWVRQFGKSVGYFTTVWKRQSDGGWKWLYDGGDELKQMRAEGGDIQQMRASCDGTPTGAVVLGTAAAQGYSTGGGRSPDGTLVWSWTVGPKGERHFLAQLWNGRGFDTVVDDRVAAAAE